MKYINKLKCVASVLMLGVAGLWLTGCDDNGSNNSNNGGVNTGTNAPTSIAGRALTHSITGGTAPLPTAGSFVLRPDGNAGDTTGNYTITGAGGVTNSTGTYTYTMTDTNTATLVLIDGGTSQETDENLLFQTTRSGTFSSSSPSGGTQNGTFTVQ
jgi:hypothetical protein